MKKFDELFGDQCKILDMALHMDEATPHVHVRRVWIAKNDDGQEYVNQKKALEQMGITGPDQDKPEGRYNNPKMTFTQTDIQLFKDICIERGLDIDKDPPKKRKSLSTLDYKKKQVMQDIEALERERDGISNDIKKTKEAMEELDEVLNAIEEYFDTNPYFEDRYEDEIREAKEKSREERFRLLARIYDNEVEKVIRSRDDFEKAALKAEAGNEARNLRRFIKEKGLEAEFENFLNSERQTEQSKEVPKVNSFF